MKALVYTAPETLVFEDREMPQPQKGEVRIKTSYAGICGSDIKGYLGKNGRKIPPVVFGHEVSGIVSALGEGATGVNVGDEVTVMPILSCHDCIECNEGLINLCNKRNLIGVMSQDGGMAEEFCVPAWNVCKLPENVSLKLGALCEPFAVCYRGVKNAGDIEGKTILVRGTGPIGYLTILAAKFFKPAKIYVKGSDPKRLEIACSLGAEIYEPGTRIDAAIECNGSEAAVNECIDLVKNHGTVSLVGLDMPYQNLHVARIVSYEINIRGSYVYTMEDFKEALELMGKNADAFGPIINKLVPFNDEVIELFRQLNIDKGPIIKAMIEFGR